MDKIILTGDRPTGKLHLGHYVGSLKERVNFQNNGDYDKMYVFIADMQALTDNASNPEKIREHVLEVMLDYLSVGLVPEKTTFFLQSQIPALSELTMYYMNLVSISRVLRNPTVKSEIKLRGFDNESKGIPMGFANYPISQAADITAFKANIVPVGEDQLPMLEQSREIVRTFNKTYKDILVEPEPKLPDNKTCLRLPGLDGKTKMSKSLNNCIYLSDDKETVSKKIKQMYTDCNHIKLEDPGQVEGNAVFIYLDAFCEDEHFKKFLPEYKNLDELKAHYQKGGLGDSKIKKFLNVVLEDILEPIRAKRKMYEQDLELVLNMLEKGSKEASKVALETLKEVKESMGINYFDDKDFIIEQMQKYKDNQ